MARVRRVPVRVTRRRHQQQFERTEVLDAKVLDQSTASVQVDALGVPLAKEQPMNDRLTQAHVMRAHGKQERELALASATELLTPLRQSAADRSDGRANFDEQFVLVARVAKDVDPSQLGWLSASASVPATSVLASRARLFYMAKSVRVGDAAYNALVQHLGKEPCVSGRRLRRFDDG